jgi:hypothetical protein
MKRLARAKKHAAIAAALTAAAAISTLATAQQPMGTVLTHDASVAGSLEVHAERATLLSNDSITAFDHTAAIDLARGGQALVCATSQFHLLHAGAGPALLFGLDRGAIEISSPAQLQDVVLTPDIRFTVETPGSFDLHVRVTREGDTCVDNRGPHSPVLLLASAFGDATYRILPGQHVLFERGDLHQVVDNEPTPCGCPESAPAATPLPPDATPAQLAAAEHPFPAAASQGLATTPEPTPPTRPAAQSTTDFHINAGDTAPIALTSTPPAPEPAAIILPSTPPKSPPGAHAILHKIGGFFRRLFTGKPSDPDIPTQ